MVSNPSVEVQSVYFTAPAKRVILKVCLAKIAAKTHQILWEQWLEKFNKLTLAHED